MHSLVPVMTVLWITARINAYQKNVSISENGDNNVVSVLRNVGYYEPVADQKVSHRSMIVNSGINVFLYTNTIETVVF